MPLSALSIPLLLAEAGKVTGGVPAESRLAEGVLATVGRVAHRQGRATI